MDRFESKASYSRDLHTMPLQLNSNRLCILKGVCKKYMPQGGEPCLSVVHLLCIQVATCTPKSESSVEEKCSFANRASSGWTSSLTTASLSNLASVLSILAEGHLLRWNTCALILVDIPLQLINIKLLHSGFQLLRSCWGGFLHTRGRFPNT